MKKTPLLILTVFGAALLASAAEPTKPETPSSTETTTMSATTNVSGLDAADKAYDAKVGERLVQSGVVTTKPKHSANKGFVQSLNPFAPMKPAPTTPWISRASWNEVATTEHQRSPASATTAEINREAKLKVTVWRD